MTGTLDHTGEQTDTDFATFTNVELEGVTLFGGNITYDVSDTFSLYIRGENLSDEDYEEVVGFLAPPRQILGGIRASF